VKTLPPTHPLERAIVPLLALGVVLLGFARLRFAATEPLWFDEAFTLAITSQPDWSGFWREVYLDSNGPAFYLLLRLWTDLFGASDLALRIPSLLAVAAAGAIPLVTPLRGLSRSARTTWAVLIFAWWGVGYFLDARCYGVLLAVSTGQCLAFARLLDRPDRKRALVWAATGAVAILFHYYAVFLGLAQGLIYLGWCRQRAVRTWPAALAFVPAFAWIAYHWPRLADYSRLAAVWHAPIDGRRAFELVGFAIGPTSPVILPAVAVVLAAGLLAAVAGRSAAPGEDRATARPLTLTAASGLLAFALMLAFGVLGSGLSPRYLIPVAPPLLLGIVLVACAGPRGNLTCAALIVLYAGLLVQPTLAAFAPARPLPRYEFETGSRFLMDHGVTDVVFAWDHELAPIMTATTLARVGGAFFDRAGRPIRIHPIVLDPGRDPNRDIVQAARGPRPGLIWLFNRDGRTAAHRFAPAIARDPHWLCTAPGGGAAGALACYRRAGAP